jgi:hypothetical protein
LRSATKSYGLVPIGRFRAIGILDRLLSWNEAAINNVTKRAQSQLPEGCTMLLFLGVISFVLAVVDGVAVLLGFPLTAVSWSPLLFVVLGFLFLTLENWQRETKPS